MATPPKDKEVLGQLVVAGLAGTGEALPGESLEEQLATVQVGLQNRFYENECVCLASAVGPTSQLT